ncbi:bacterio-opsin activator domain-containing protein [Halovivax limisalsi]|uniref:bacterio-opsin activator domain-containing protein n=1 Tax=Halovivax limisalsi TaxID=1453760 RepID=UPI001FFD4FAE|nr:bacterio-opsin activator domain-containing protein [Halovivax limisalsi]
MDRSSQPGDVSLRATRRCFVERDDPGAPRTTPEVAAELDCPTGVAAERLATLAERGDLRRKRLDSDTCVWWQAVDERSERHPLPAERAQDGHRDQEVAEQFRLLVDSVEEYAIFMTDPDGYIRSWNAGAQQVKGYAKDEILGEHISVFYTEDAAADGVPERNLEAARRTGLVEDEGWRVRKDGSRFWANVTLSPIRDDADELVGFAKVTRDMTERHASERRLRREKERVQRMIEEVRDYAIFRLDTDGFIQTWNEGAERIKGYAEDEIVGEHLSTFYPDDEETIDPGTLLDRAAAEGRAASEGWRARKDGSRFWAGVVLTAIHDDGGELAGFAKITRDLTERKRREDRLAALDELGRALLAAETSQDVSEIVVEAAETELDLPISTIALYDEERGRLAATGRTTRAAASQSDVPFLDPSSGVAWEAFGADEPIVVDDPDTREEADTSLTGGVVVPIGGHGVFIVGCTDEPSEETIDLAKIVAADAETALNQAERQHLLREREATLADQNERLERLNRINDVIRTIDQSLVDATSRTEIEQAVCTELATARPYRFAWIGHRESASGSITPRTWAGVESGYLETLSASDRPRGDHPASIAARSRSPAVAQDLRTDPPFDPWRKAALERGVRSAIAVPIRYEDSLYGVLTVYADESDAFTEMERAVVAELGETAGHAINALESKRALVGDEIVELEFVVRDPSLPILRLVAAADCAFEFDGVQSHTDGDISGYFTTRGAEPAAVESAVEELLAVTDLRRIGDGSDACSFEAVLTEESFVRTLLDHGAAPATIVAEDGEATVVVELSTRADVREFVEMLRTKYPDSELTARRTRDRAARTPQGFAAAFEDRITDRQAEVLRTAYFSGFFDSPRATTGREIGEALGISQPTVAHHLRAAQRELLGLLYERAQPPVTLDR